MDAKELKTTLKNAQKAIKLKNYEEVHKLAKEILKHDPKNYHGLVFLAIALPEIDSNAVKPAVEAYREAAAICPDQHLAWQGLATLYEKNPIKVYQEACIEVYKKLMEIFEKAGGDASVDKYFETGVKLGKLLCDRKNIVSAAEAFENLLEKAERDGDETVSGRTVMVARAAADCLGKDHDQGSLIAQGTLIEKVFMVLVTVDDLDDKLKTDYYKKLISTMITNKRNVMEIIGMCQLMMATFPDAFYPLEIMTHFEMSLSLEAMPDLNRMDELKAKIKSLKPKSHLITVLDGIDYYVTNNYIQARNQLKLGLDSHTSRPNIPGSVYLAKAYTALHDHAGAIALAKTTKKYLSTAEDGADLAFIAKHRVISDLNLVIAQATIEGGGTDLEIGEAMSSLELALSDQSQACGSDPLAAFGFSSLSEDKIEKVFLTAKQQGLTSNSSIVALEGVLMVKQKNFDSALEQFGKAIELNPDRGQHHYWYGRTLWEQAGGNETEFQKDLCFSELLLAAKLDPYYSPTFLYLGHFYSKIQKEDIKALKCYQRSFDLDNSNGEAGSICVDFMVSSGRGEQAYQLLIRVTKLLGPRLAKWAWLRLALHFLNIAEYEAAVTTLQDLLKADSSDWIVWECLGEAYSSRGSYTAAIKAFERAIEIEPGASFSQFQTAQIKQITGLFLEAKQEYLHLLEGTNADFIPAIKGLGETLIALAKESLSKFFNRKATDLCELAIKHLTHAATLRPDLICIWKLLGDACTILHTVPDQYCILQVPAKLAYNPYESGKKLKMRKIFTFENAWDVADQAPVAWDEPDQPDTGGDAKEQRVRVRRNRRGGNETAADVVEDPKGDKEVNKLDLLLIGNRCYRRALKLQSEVDAGLLHDLGFNYFAQFSTIDEEEEEARLEVALSALECLKEAVTLEPNNHLYWMALGTIAACTPPSIQQLPLAQHAFIQSVQCEPDNAPAWTNLGALYLLHGPSDKKLAHLAFKKGQNIDPGYVGAWVGQALIAEAIGDPEAMDLFRVTVSMENSSIHSEGLLGYGHWVCKMLLFQANKKSSDSSGYPSDVHLHYILEKMGALTVASDALSKFCDRFPEHVPAATMLAMLEERLGLKQSAVNHLNRVLDSLKGRGISKKGEINSIKRNYARVLCALDKAQESVAQYKQLPELETSFNLLTGLGLALFKLGKLTEAYVVFEKAAEIVADSEEIQDRTCIQVCLGMVSHKYNDFEGAKTCLFKCTELDPTCLPGLVALSAIGMIHDDHNLSMAAIQELLAMSALSDIHAVEVAKLLAALCLEQNDYKRGKAHIQKAVFSHPNSAKLWTHLSQYILRYAKGEGEMAAVAACCATSVDAKNEEGPLLQSLGMLVSSSPAELKSASIDSKKRKVHSAASKSAITAAAKAVHLHPDRLEAWTSLTASTYMMDVLQRVATQDTPIVREGASLSASTAAYSIASSKAVFFTSQASLDSGMHAFIAKHHVFNLLIDGGSSLKEAKRIVNALQDGNLLESMGPVLFHLELLLNRGLNNRTMESLKEAIMWENGPFSRQLLTGILAHSKRFKEVEDIRKGAIESCHSGELVFLSHLVSEAFTVLARSDDPLSTKTPEYQAISEIVSQFSQKQSVSNIIDLIEGITSYKSNIKKAQKALLKVHNATFPPPISTFPAKIARRLLVKVLAGKREKEKSTLDTLKEAAIKDDDLEYLKIHDQIVPAL